MLYHDSTVFGQQLACDLAVAHQQTILQASLLMGANSQTDPVDKDGASLLR